MDIADETTVPACYAALALSRVYSSCGQWEQALTNADKAHACHPCHATAAQGMWVRHAIKSRDHVDVKRLHRLLGLVTQETLDAGHPPIERADRHEVMVLVCLDMGDDQGALDQSDYACAAYANLRDLGDVRALALAGLGRPVECLKECEAAAKDVAKLEQCIEGKKASGTDPSPCVDMAGWAYRCNAIKVRCALARCLCHAAVVASRNWPLPPQWSSADLAWLASADRSPLGKRHETAFQELYAAHLELERQAKETAPLLEVEEARRRRRSEAALRAESQRLARAARKVEAEKRKRQVEADRERKRLEEEKLVEQQLAEEREAQRLALEKERARREAAALAAEEAKRDKVERERLAKVKADRRAAAAASKAEAAAREERLEAERLRRLRAQRQVAARRAAAALADRRLVQEEKRRKRMAAVAQELTNKRGSGPVPATPWRSAQAVVLPSEPEPQPPLIPRSPGPQIALASKLSPWAEPFVPLARRKPLPALH